MRKCLTIFAFICALGLLTSCATYHVTTPEGWVADVRTTRKLESAKIYVSPDGSMEVELGGVDYPDFSRYLPYPIPVYPPMSYGNKIPPANKYRAYTP